MTVNAGRYSEKLIKLRRTIQIRRRGLLSSGVVLLHDYALSHVAVKRRSKLDRFCCEFLDHPPYNPASALSNFQLCKKTQITSGYKSGEEQRSLALIINMYNSSCIPLHGVFGFIPTLLVANDVTLCRREIRMIKESLDTPLVILNISCGQTKSQTEDRRSITEDNTKPRARETNFSELLDWKFEEIQTSINNISISPIEDFYAFFITACRRSRMNKDVGRIAQPVIDDLKQSYHRQKTS
ncbi:hypothetical protein J6590_093828 [Homalodisca vitripennis]|nr:hypothetical protein J6590_093828 [Homalodisca vitripennis]